MLCQFYFLTDVTFFLQGEKERQREDDAGCIHRYCACIERNPLCSGEHQKKFVNGFRQYE
jgi:hypothetical protein